MKIVVLRLGHRIERDKRVTTHCCLTARAFGAEKIILSGEKDSAILEGVKKVSAKWGGSFQIEYEKDWKKVIQNFNGKIVHLTFYGVNLPEAIGEIRKEKEDLLIIIGAEKVPSEVYGLVDYNIAVGNQPHSEVAALAVFLHELFEGRELEKEFKGWKVKIEGREKGKKILKGN